MRFTEFTLERYGAFAERSLSIPSQTGLVIVYGLNEAGKSTCLAAISDFLFGIPDRTTHAALFGYEGMRLGATVMDSAGNKQTLRRRRGRVRTLTDTAGNSLDEAVLSRFLGATTRERFNTLFGLNHETLRSGGASLLSADGDIGRLIVEAGGGLRSLIARLDAVEEEAAKLFSPRRSGDRAFYKALDAFQEADKEVKALAVSRDAFEQARKAAAKADDHLANLRIKKQKLLAEISSLERLTRTLPHLKELDRINVELAEFEDIKQHAGDLHLLVDSALAQVAQAEADLTSARANRDRLLARETALEVQPGFAEAEGAIREVAEQLIIIRKARSDRPNRVRELDAAESQLSTLRRMLQLAPDAPIEDRLPQQSCLDRVQLLANQAIERGGTLSSAKAHAQDLQEQVGALQARIESAKMAGFDKPGTFSANQFSSLPTQAAALDLSERQAVSGKEAIDSSIESLGFSSVEALEAFSCPSPDEIRSEQQWHAGLDEELKTAADRLIRAESKISLAEEAIRQLEIAGPVASEETLASARGARADAWTPIRSSFIANTVPEDVAARSSALESFEQKLSSADGIADRRTFEAERAAKLALARQQLVDSSTERRECQKLTADLQCRVSSRRKTWTDAFPQAAERYPELPALLSFAERKLQLLDEQVSALALVANAERLKSELGPTQTLLAKALKEAGLSAPTGPELAESVQELTARLSEHELEHSEFKRDLRDYEAQKPTAARAQRDYEALQKEQSAWEMEWPSALASLGLKGNLAPEQAGTLIAEWSAARGTLATIKQTHDRLSRMDEDEERLKNTADVIAESLAIKLPDDAVAAADMLVSRWKVQDACLQQSLALAPEIKEAESVFLGGETLYEESQGELAQLVEAASAADVDALTALSERCKARADLQDGRERISQALAATSDGFTAETLREQIAGRELDELSSALLSARDQSSDLEGEVEEAILSKKSASDDLARFGEESRINSAVAARESAAARMQSVVERYVELSLACDLISEAVDRVRSEQQDPLIKRASELFSFATVGKFSKIDCDLDDKGQPVVIGKRATGGDVTVAAMSDGTRDQMFLAFRLASLENYATSAEPLPFVADDILVHFDDQRSRATLDLLAEFGETNQVLLFTHHQSVREQARALEEKGLASVLELELA